MADPRTLRDRTLLASLGLDEQDVKAINQKIKMAKKLKETFIEIDDDTNIVSADILFVNAEKESTMEYYDKCHPHLSAVPVFVYTNKALEEAESEAAAAIAAAEAAEEEDKEEEKAAAEAATAKAKALSLKKYENAIAIKKPLTLSRLTDVLFNIVSSNESAPTKTIEASEESDSSDDTVNPVQQSLPVSTGVFKVLVVDDSFPVRKYLEKKLPTLLDEIDSSLEIDIEFANSGRESVDKVTEARGEFDMVFLDVMMEDVNGYEVCKWIKKVKSSINVVMLTSKSSPFDRVRAKLSGCNNFISKPPKDKQLKKVILAHKKFK